MTEGSEDHSGHEEVHDQADDSAAEQGLGDILAGLLVLRSVDGRGLPGACAPLGESEASEDSGEPDLGRTGADLLTKAITCEHARDFGCFFKLDKPIVGIGAPSGVYIRWVGDVLGTDVIVCDDSDVGNAVGAICASVSESVKFSISPMKAVEGSAYEVFSRFGRAIYTTMDEAVERCVEQGREFVTKAALDNNAEFVEVTVDLDRRPYVLNLGSTDLEEATLVVTAAGKPRMF